LKDRHLEIDTNKCVQSKLLEWDMDIITEEGMEDDGQNDKKRQLESGS
jgi:hypothetical protein